MVDTRTSLKEKLDQCFAPDHPRGLDKIAEVLTYISEEGQVTALLDEILLDPEWLQAAASKSYAHSNGFDKLVLLSSHSPSYKLRLHIWWPEAPQSTEDIHNHRWDFGSVILMGGYQYQQYARALDGEEYWEHQYSPVGDRGFFSLKQIGTANLSKVFDCKLIAGCSYSLSSSIFHRIVGNPGELTATLMLQGAQQADHTSVFTNLPDINSSNIPTPPLSADELAEKLQSFIAAYSS